MLRKTVIPMPPAMNTWEHDGPTAEVLVRDVLAAAEDRTVLLITHRSEGLDLVDEVVRLDGCVGGEHARRPQGRAL
jgi:ABC-type transport system involved in cytochrome bd biosynthesis fused ATPase/permease subunit